MPLTQSQRERNLMRSIKKRWGSRITLTCAGTSISPDFIGALISVESAGDPFAKRFEPHVFNRLKRVRAGKVAKLKDPISPVKPIQLQGLDDETLWRLAHSYGLTQIMGYHSHFNDTGSDPVSLFNASVSLSETCDLLTRFAEKYNLDLDKDYEKLGRAWNTGTITRPTYSKAYLPRILRRMKIYATLPV